VHVHIPYQTVPGEVFTRFLHWYNLEDAVAEYVCDARDKGRGGRNTGHFFTWNYIKNEYNILGILLVRYL